MFGEFEKDLRKVKTLTPEEEEDLWYRFKKQDDETARDSIVVAYQPLVFKLAMQMKTPSSLKLDIIQEGTIGLINSVDRFEPDRGVRFLTYAYYRVRGRMLNYLYRHEIKAPLPVEEIEDDACDRDGLASPQDILAEEEDMERLIDCVAKLPEKERQVVKGLFFGELSAREVARAIGIGVSHVYRLQQRALTRLREMLS